jgi:hypothetical protein
LGIITALARFYGAPYALSYPVQRIIKHLAVIGALQMGAFAQPIVLSPPADMTPERTLNPTIRTTGTASGTALAVEVDGSCKYSIDGKSFHSLKKNFEIPEHATIRTGHSGNTELFVRRMGATVRLHPDTEIAVDRIKIPIKDEQKELKTTIEVRKGEVLTVVHATIPGSTLDIKNAAGETLKNATVGGRYEISANTIQIAGPEKLSFESKGESKEKIAAMIKEQIDMDEVQGLAETSDDSNPGLEP